MCWHSSVRVVIDTSVFVGAILDHAVGASRKVLRRCLLRELFPAMGTALSLVYYRWRPRLVDEADHHLLELAIASGAEAIVTKNVRHLRSGELRFPQILQPEDLLEER